VVKLRLGTDLLLKRVAFLEAQVACLQAEKARLEAENARLEAEKARLEAENARLAAENAELRRRLGLNSQNSHKPPSSDGYRKKRARPALPKEKKPLGGQPGHKGKTLRPVERPDRVEVHLPEHCAVCGRPIAPDEPYQMVGRRQVFDLPEPRLEVTEHQTRPRPA